MAMKDPDDEQTLCFLGAGAYDHYIPSVVGQIVGRSGVFDRVYPDQPDIAPRLFTGVMGIPEPHLSVDRHGNGCDFAGMTGDGDLLKRRLWPADNPDATQVLVSDDRRRRS